MTAAARAELLAELEHQGDELSLAAAETIRELEREAAPVLVDSKPQCPICGKGAPRGSSAWWPYDGRACSDEHGLLAGRTLAALRESADYRGIQNAIGVLENYQRDLGQEALDEAADAVSTGRPLRALQPDVERRLAALHERAADVGALTRVIRGVCEARPEGIPPELGEIAAAVAAWLLDAELLENVQEDPR